MQVFFHCAIYTIIMKIRDKSLLEIVKCNLNFNLKNGEKTRKTFQYEFGTRMLYRVSENFSLHDEFN